MTALCLSSFLYWKEYGFLISAVYFIDLCFTMKAVGFLPLLEVCPVYVIYAYWDRVTEVFEEHRSVYQDSVVEAPFMCVIFYWLWHGSCYVSLAAAYSNAPQARIFIIIATGVLGCGTLHLALYNHLILFIIHSITLITPTFPEEKQWFMDMHYFL